MGKKNFFSSLMEEFNITPKKVVGILKKNEIISDGLLDKVGSFLKATEDIIEPETVEEHEFQSKGARAKAKQSWKTEDVEEAVVVEEVDVEEVKYTSHSVVML